jgi:hypothetical protein
MEKWKNIVVGGLIIGSVLGLTACGGSSDSAPVLTIQANCKAEEQIQLVFYNSPTNIPGATSGIEDSHVEWEKYEAESQQMWGVKDDAVFDENARLNFSGKCVNLVGTSIDMMLFNGEALSGKGLRRIVVKNIDGNVVREIPLTEIIEKNGKLSFPAKPIS